MTNTTTLPAAPVYVDTTWHDADESPNHVPGDRAYRETDDPRLLAIVERTSSDYAPDGDVYAPAYWVEYRGAWNLTRAGSGFDDDDAREAVERAWGQWGRSHETAARFLRAFHGITVHEVHGPSQGDLLVILDTPAHRAETGDDTATPAPSDEWVAGDVATWRAYVDGDVYAIGHAVNPLRTSHDEPVDLDDWTVEIESYGYYGDDWAHEAAAALDGAPDAAALDALTAQSAHSAATVRYAITLDDEDRNDAPEISWTATVQGEAVSEAGIGGTPGDALRALAAILDQSA